MAKHSKKEVAGLVGVIILGIIAIAVALVSVVAALAVSAGVYAALFIAASYVLNTALGFSISYVFAAWVAVGYVLFKGTAKNVVAYEKGAFSRKAVK